MAQHVVLSPVQPHAIRLLYHPRQEVPPPAIAAGLFGCHVSHSLTDDFPHDPVQLSDGCIEPRVLSHREPPYGHDRVDGGKGLSPRGGIEDGLVDLMEGDGGFERCEGDAQDRGGDYIERYSGKGGCDYSPLVSGMEVMPGNCERDVDRCDRLTIYDTLGVVHLRVKGITHLDRLLPHQGNELLEVRECKRAFHRLASYPVTPAGNPYPNKPTLRKRLETKRQAFNIPFKTFRCTR